MKKLEITGLQSLFAPHIYSVDQVVAGKQAPDLFLYSAGRLNVDQRRWLVIEDAIHGVMAAIAAGMTPIGFVGGGHAGPGPDHHHHRSW